MRKMAERKNSGQRDSWGMGEQGRRRKDEGGWKVSEDDNVFGAASASAPAPGVERDDDVNGGGVDVGVNVAVNAVGKCGSRSRFRGR